MGWPGRKRNQKDGARARVHTHTRTHTQPHTHMHARARARARARTHDNNYGKNKYSLIFICLRILTKFVKWEIWTGDDAEVCILRNLTSSRISLWALCNQIDTISWPPSLAAGYRGRRNYGPLCWGSRVINDSLPLRPGMAQNIA